MSAPVEGPESLVELDRRVLAAALGGLPLCEAPYAELASNLGVGEDDVLECLARLESLGVLKRFGLVVRHHELGFRANGMCVFDVEDERVGESAKKLKELPYVTLCYRRRRDLPRWRYNLFCMIHGTDRAEVEAQYAAARVAAGLGDVPTAILFSRRRFKQCAGRYVADDATKGPKEPNRRAA